MIGDGEPNLSAERVIDYATLNFYDLINGREAEIELPTVLQPLAVTDTGGINQIAFYFETEPDSPKNRFRARAFLFETKIPPLFQHVGSIRKGSTTAHIYVAPVTEES